MGSGVDQWFTVADGLRLHFRNHPGDERKPPLLCLPGLTRNVRDFAEVAERIAPRWRVIALEFRGRGSSDPDPLAERYTPLTYAGDTIALLDHLGIGQAIFLGTSLGGIVTMIAAAVAPQRVAAAILNDVGPELHRTGLERIRTYVGKPIAFGSWDEAARRLAANNPGLSQHYGHEQWLRMAQRTCREEGGHIRFDYDMALAQAFAAPAAEVDLWPLFRALAGKPLLLVRGERSDLLSAQTAEAMKREAPGMEVAVVKGVGHAPDLDEPEAVAAIDRFLAGFEEEASTG